MNNGEPESARRVKQRARQEATGLQVAGEALTIFGAMPLEIHLLYYLGTLPFGAAFLYFWFDMLKNAYAQDTLLVWSLILPLLFIWMKCWQAIYLQCLNSWLYHKPVPRYTLPGIVRLILFTAILQPLGFLVIPLAMLVGVPYPASIFFFQDILLSEKLYEEGFMARCAASWRCAWASPGQGLMLTWLFSPWQMCLAGLMIGVLTFFSRFFGLEQATGGGAASLAAVLILQIASIGPLTSPLAFMLASGISTLAFILPWIMDNLLGIETAYSHGYTQMLSSVSFVAIVFLLVFMLLDPLVKIATVLRRFQYLSRSSGEDLLFSLETFSRKARQTSVLLFLLLFSGLALPAASQTAESQALLEKAPVAEAQELAAKQGKLDGALEETLRKSRYTWRMPRELAAKPDKTKKTSGWFQWLETYLERFQEQAEEYRRAFSEWLDKLFSGSEDSGKESGWWKGLGSVGFIEGLFYVLTATLVITCLLLLVKWLQQRKSLLATPVSPMSKPVVNIHDHRVSAEDLPMDEWLAMAHNFAEQGDYRAAMRALFLGVLAGLGQRDLITLRNYKSNHDYTRELTLRARGKTEIIKLFNTLTYGMECTWYGFAPATETLCHEYQITSALLRQTCEAVYDNRPTEVRT
jgi:hypothetical protein